MECDTAEVGGVGRWGGDWAQTLTDLQEGCESDFGRTERETGRGQNEDVEDSITEQ